MEQQFIPHPVPRDVNPEAIAHHTDVISRVNTLRQKQADNLKGDDYISPSELAKAVRRLPRRKAAGHDHLPIAALHQLPKKAVIMITKLFNGILRTAHFPDSWKTAKVIMIPKPGKDKRVPASYRPISLLPHLAKLFERLLLGRIRHLIQPRAEQFGFRRQHSTTLQLTRVLHMLALEMNQKRHTVAVFLDVEKAFDRVWHEGLLYKLADTEVPHAFWHLIDDYLTNRKFYVSVDQKDSSTKFMLAGVPQGGCLSPALYALYTNDIPTLKGLLQDGERDVELALFADDSAYLYASPNPCFAAEKMQELLNLLPDWLDRWRMAVNVGKTAALLISNKRALPKTKLKLRGQEVPWQTCTKYLGVHIDRKLNMNTQAQHAIKNTRTARALLGPVLRSKLPLRTKLGIYKTYVRSILTYATPAWYGLCNATTKKRLQAQQNIALRTCTGAGRYVSNNTIAKDINVETVEKFVVRLARKMYDAADNGPHTHLHGIAPHPTRPPDDKGKKRWRPLPRELLDLDSTTSSGDDGEV